MRILLAVDGGEHSRMPVDVLLERCWPSGCEIKVLTVVESPSGSGETAEFLGPICERIKFRFPDAVVESEAVAGNSKEVLLDKSTSSDLIVMGARGRRGLSRILLGSVSQTVLLYGSCSTLIARYADDSVPASLDKVLVAVDRSDHSGRAIDHVVRLPWSEKTQFKLVSVLPPLVESYSDGFSVLYSSQIPADHERARSLIEGFLQECARQLKSGLGNNNVTTELLIGDPAERILQLAGEWGAQLIVMGSRGLGGVKKLWLGSVSQEVVLQAPCPVEVVKASSAVSPGPN